MSDEKVLDEIENDESAQEFNEEDFVPPQEDEGVQVVEEDGVLEITASAEGTELDSFDSAEVEDLEFLEQDQVVSIVESILFSTDKPQTVGAIKAAFKGTTVKVKDVKKALEELMIEYAGAKHGVTLEEVNNGFQLRTKIDNVNFLKRMIKGRSFRLSGPALEVLAIAAYKQPCVKSQIDEIRGVESGHLLRGLMERGMVNFAGKSELPGKPMLYCTTKKFLEIFGLRNINELPSLNEIDELIPEGIGEIEEEKETLDMITDDLSKEASTSTYSEGEEELMKITGQLEDITTSSDFFEQEKQRMKQKRERERAQDIRDALAVEEDVSTKDQRWLERYDAAQEELRLKAEQEQQQADAIEAAAQADSDEGVEPESVEVDVENYSAEEIAAVIAASGDEVEVPHDKVLVESHDDDQLKADAADEEKLEEDLAIFDEEHEAEPGLEKEPENT